MKRERDEEKVVGCLIVVSLGKGYEQVHDWGEHDEDRDGSLDHQSEQKHLLELQCFRRYRVVSSGFQ